MGQPVRRRSTPLAVLLTARVPAALDSLWCRAAVASHVAKIATTQAGRKTAYAVKTAAISQALRVAPAAIAVSDGSQLAYGLVGLYVDRIGGLHVPIARLDDDVRPLVEAKIVAAFSAPTGAPVKRVSADLAPTQFAEFAWLPRIA